jgi:UDP-3-O-[3-hydroxymyristoyl] glucosamine N-acyltransferase
MPDSAASFSLGDIAQRFGCTLRGDPERRVATVATLAGGPDAIGYLANPAMLAQLHGTRLGAVIIAAPHATECPESSAALIHPNPHAAFAQIAAALHPQAPARPGIHPTAVIHEDARIAGSAEIGPFVIVGAGAVIGERCRIAAQVIVGDNVMLGADTRLAERVTVLDGCRIGARCIVHPGVVIGSDGFGNARLDARWIKVPQLGAVRIGDDVEIGANTTIDRGALDDTLIEDGVRLDNLIQVAHNVTIGAHTAIAACVGIAGSTRIGRRCMIGGGAGIGGQLTIGDDIVIGGFGQVTRSIAGPGMYTNVLPAEEAGVWRRIVGRIKRLEQLAARVGRLEAAVKAVPKTGQETEHDKQ